MIVVVGRVQTNADKREDLIRIGQAVAQASRAEAGCISYRVYEDTEVENDFVFVEEWEDSQALKRHFATSHIAEFMRAIPESVDVDGSLTGSAAAGPAPEERLQEQHGLRERQAGRGRKGFSRSRVRNPWAAVTIAVW